MFSNGNSFTIGERFNPGLDGKLAGEVYNTECWLWKRLAPIQPHACD